MKLEKALRGKLPRSSFQRVSGRRSENMRAIKATGNRTTELSLRLALVRAGLRGWIVRPSRMLGNPDLVFPEKKIAIFADGCFWHGCPHCYHAPVKNNSAYWTAKVKRNRLRDAKTSRQLRAEGWRVVRFWEHDLKGSPDKVIRRIQDFLATKGPGNLRSRIRSAQQKSA
ncbi:MAG: very short patch repair endonuclease [Acidobacteria bacterium]|nr:very short patch repair endonuclease [Acidobacteriota bacterium]